MPDISPTVPADVKSCLAPLIDDNVVDSHKAIVAVILMASGQVLIAQIVDNSNGCGFVNIARSRDLDIERFVSFPKPVP